MNMELVPVGAAAFIVAWADHRPIKTWNCSYTMRRVGKNWLFTLITSDDTDNDQAGLGPA